MIHNQVDTARSYNILNKGESERKKQDAVCPFFHLSLDNLYLFGVRSSEVETRFISTL